MFSFIVFSLHDKYGAEFDATVPAMVARGEFRYLEDVTEGLERAGEAILAVRKLEGANLGKSGTLVANDSRPVSMDLHD